MSSLFARKLIADSPVDRGLRRKLGATDLVFLAIGAVVGAGIFSSLGTAAAGEMNPAGQVVRLGAGPALVLSLVLAGFVCALSALCYAELASMIPEAGSAYAYAYATIGELAAWIIGWDLLLEYAVGNVAVAIAWSGYANSLLSGFGIDLPGWLTRGYFNVTRSTDPEMLAVLKTAPSFLGVPILIDVPALLIVAAVTWLLLRGVRESIRANTIMVVIKLIVLALFIGVGVTHIDTAHYRPFAPNGFAGIHQGAAIIFFAYIGFDAVSTAAEETVNPQRNLPIGILLGLAICTLLYMAVALVATGLVPYSELAKSDPLAYALNSVGLPGAAMIVAGGAVVATTAVLLVFQYGQPRIFYAMARDGLLPEAVARIDPKSGVPRAATIITGFLVALGSAIADDDATYDLTNIGTLFAFFLVCVGVALLRIWDPNRPRPFRVPYVWVIAPLGALSCVGLMFGLPGTTWIRFAVWLVIGLVLYFAFGYRNSVLRKNAASSK